MRSYIYSDIDPRLTMLRTGTVQIRYNEDVIHQSIKNIIATISGERIRNPIGSSIVKLLFEPMNNRTADDIRYQFHQILVQEPRIQIVELVITPLYDQNAYNMWLTYSIKSIPGLHTFQTKLRTLYA